MRLLRALVNLLRSWVEALKRQILVLLAQLRFPTLTIDGPSVWRFDTLRALELGENVYVGAFTEIVAFSRTPRSRVAGKLILGDRVVLSTGCNIRAAGGIIRIGSHTVIAQGTVIVAANHTGGPGKLYDTCPWDEQKTGVAIGSNCWVGAVCVLLPGVSIGDNSIIGAGSVVSKPVPANQVWAGVPARFVKNVT